MSATVIGRTGELEAIERFLDALAGGPAVLVLEGEPGIGKTTLVRAGVEAAHGRGARVLLCVASGSETRLAYAALADLLGVVDGDAVERLPAPQRAALDAALLRSGPGATDVDPRAVATAVLSVLEALAEESAVVIAIDDLQWLDRPSARVVEFCARRLAGRIGLIASRRVGADDGWTAGVVGVRDPDRVELRRLEPLGAGDLQRLMRERARKPLERRSLVRTKRPRVGTPSMRSSWRVRYRQAGCRRRRCCFLRASTRSSVPAWRSSVRASRRRSWPLQRWPSRRSSCSSGCSDPAWRACSTKTRSAA